jgi:hypothetical protein
MLGRSVALQPARRSDVKSELIRLVWRHGETDVTKALIEDYTTIVARKRQKLSKKSFARFLEEAAKSQAKPKPQAKPTETRPSVAALIAAGWSQESAERHGR